MIQNEIERRKPTLLAPTASMKGMVTQSLSPEPHMKHSFKTAIGKCTRYYEGVSLRLEVPSDLEREKLIVSYAGGGTS